MSIVTSCPRCRADVRLSGSQRGKKLRCPQCEATFTTVDDDDDRPARRRKRDDRDDRDDRAPASSGGAWLKLGLACGLFFALVGGVWYYAIATTKPASAQKRDEDDEKEMGAALRPQATGQPVASSGGQSSHNTSPPPQVAPVNNNAGPQDLNGALVMLREMTAAKVRASLRWLATVRVDEARRDEVSRALNEPLTSGTYRRDAIPAVVRWATKNNSDGLIACLGDSDATTRRRAMETLAKFDDELSLEAVAKQLGVAGREAEAGRALRASPYGRMAERYVVKHLNPPRGTGRDAEQVLGVFKTPKGLMIDQSADDLGSTEVNTRKGACDWFAKTPAESDKQDRVAQTLEGVVSDQNKDVKLAAVKPLGTWGTRGSVSRVADALKDSHLRDSAMQSLLKLKYPEAIPVLAAFLNARERDQIARALVEFGSKAEKAVWLPLVRGDLETRKKACEILADIGTGESIKELTKVAALEKASRNAGNYEAAQAAIKKIRERVK